MNTTHIKTIKRSFALLTALATSVAAKAADSDPITLDWDISSTFLAMGRDYGADNSGSSASVSLSVGARSELSERINFGLKSVFVENLFKDGKETAAYWLSNDTSTELTEAYLEYKFTQANIKDGHLTIGRKELSYPFFPAYKVRHQAQSLEGVFANARITETLSLDLGHIERYSSWPSREKGASALDTSFKKLGERIGQSSIDSGVQFVSTNWSSQDLKVDLYDYYANDLYNNAGLKVTYALPISGDAKWVVSTHAMTQSGEGGGPLEEHSSNSLELNLRYKRGPVSLDTGWTQISRSNSLLAPFRTTYVNDATLLWYTNQFEAGTQTYHAKAVYSNNPWTLAAVFVHASHLDRRTEDEIDLVAKRKLSENLALCVKAGYGKCVFDEENRHHKSARDLRLFIDYKL